MDKYFATLEGLELAAELNTRVDKYFDEVERNGRMALWRTAYRAFYSLDQFEHHRGARIRNGGEQAELSLMKANHYRNLMTHLHVLCTQQRPSFECRATNTDYKSQVQAILGVNILEYYLREKRLEEHYRQAVEYCLNYGESYTTIEWDQGQGDPIAVDDDGSILKSGDIVARIYGPYDVMRTCRGDADTRQNWYILRRWENKYDLAAKYPDQAEKILYYSSDYDHDELSTFIKTYTQDEDHIPVYVFYHERTPACPNGRQAVFLDAGCLLESDDLQYRDMPVFRMAAYNQHGTSFGYTVAFDLLCVQEAIDNLYSTVLSNQLTFGVQNIWSEPGGDVTTQELAGGLNLIQSNKKPEAINLTHTPPEIFNFIKGLEGLGEMLSGVNSVARGQPEASLKSGAALALVASQAVQFSNGISSAYVRLMEETGTAVIRTLQRRAAIPRTAMIAGKSNQSFMKDYTSEDIAAVDRVVADIGNPVTRTISGRVEMANMLAQSQMIKRPEQYIQVVTTGRIEPVIDAEQAELLQIQKENEELREGRQVQAIALDMHVQHIKEHKAIFADPEARKNPQLLEAAFQHIMHHMELLRTTDPALLNVLGQAPLGAPPQGAQAPQPPENQPQGEPTPPGEQVPAPDNAPDAIADRMPNMPKPPPGAPQ
jgi:hypothetical protein